jgi:uncharacterized protein (DUF1330 family)
MKRQVTVLLALVASIGIGAAAQAQTKPKAFTFSEYEPLDKAASEAYSKVAIPVVREAGGKPTGVAGGKIVALVGEAPKGVTLVEWNSVEQAEAFYKSPAFTNLQPQADKGRKVIRSFTVEASPDFKGFTLEGSKPKAYWIRELEVINQAALNNPPASPSPALQEASRQAGRQATGTANGKIIPRTGEAPKRFALQGFSSLEQAQAFIKSPVNTPVQATKTIREYIVEAAQ